MKRKAAVLLAATALAAAPAVHSHHIKGHDGGNGGGIVICKDHPCPNGIAVGQDPTLLLTTRSSNAGIGNRAEGGKTEAHDMDPGNSGAHNQAADDDPICELIKDCDLTK